MTAATICSLLWAVTGVSVLAVALHENLHHAEDHNHDNAIEMVLHGHDHEGSPNHDHELTAPLSASRTSWSVHLNSAVSQASDVVDAETRTIRVSVGDDLQSRDLGPPAFLLHCVLLT